LVGLLSFNFLNCVFVLSVFVLRLMLNAVYVSGLSILDCGILLMVIRFNLTSSATSKIIMSSDFIFQYGDWSKRY
jgi:hypothetical protein